MTKSINILLADDELDDHELFREATKLLGAQKCNVTHVYNGMQAVQYLLRKDAYKDVKDPPPDLIVLDINMPILDGFSVLAEIKKMPLLKNTPTFILTKSRDQLHQKKCADLGCAGFFSKPPTLSELKQVIQKMISG